MQPNPDSRLADVDAGRLTPDQVTGQDTVADLPGSGGLSLAHTAREAARREWHVFPVLPGSKRPAIHDWPNRTTADPAKVARGWPTGYNVGIACGPSRLVVVDLDTGKPLPPPWDAEPGAHDGLDVLATLLERRGQSWPDTYTVATPRGGQHLYFTAPASQEIRNSAGQIGPLVDIRAAGGYVVGAGSVVDGKPYTVISDVDAAPLPDWLAALAAAPQPVAARPLPATLRTPDKYVAAAFEDELAAVAAAWEGSRNHQLNKSAYALARFVAAGQVDRDVAAAALSNAAEYAGLTSTEIARTIWSAFKARGAA